MISQDIIHYRGIAFTRFGEEGGPLCAGGELMPLKRGGNTHTVYIQFGKGHIIWRRAQEARWEMGQEESGILTEATAKILECYMKKLGFRRPTG